MRMRIVRRTSVSSAEHPYLVRILRIACAEFAYFMRIASVSHAYLPWFFGFLRRFSTISADEIIFFTDASADIRTCPCDLSITATETSFSKLNTE